MWTRSGDVRISRSVASVSRAPRAAATPIGMGWRWSAGSTMNDGSDMTAKSTAADRKQPQNASTTANG
jgi:hypothetical protein